MLRTLFSVGLMAMVGLFLMKVVFGLFAGFVRSEEHTSELQSH